MDPVFWTKLRTAVLLWSVLAGITGFVSMAADKHRAKTGGWRTPEIVLIAIAALGGAIGTFLGAIICRHKTKHTMLFAIIILLASAELIAIVFVLLKAKIALM